MFQDPDVQLLAGTVEEEISFGPMNLGLPREEVQRRVQHAMESLDLLSYRTRGPQYLSGGEKRRVAIAGVLAMEPNVMLLDEPSSNLDPAGQALLNQILERLHEKGITLLIATHDVDFAWQWADRVLVFREGRLEKDAAPADVFADEALIKRCGLESPMLWKVARALHVPAPRSPEGFAHIKWKEDDMKQAFLCVSFGTSVPAARKNITAVEEALKPNDRTWIFTGPLPARRFAAI